MSRADVFIVAAEPSGGNLAAGLIRSLKRQAPDIEIAAIGGAELAPFGIQSRMDIEGLAILGFVEGLKAYGLVLRKVREAVSVILDENPACVVLIDSWGFMVRVAKGLKAKGYSGQIIKYVAPQVWAMRSGRAKILARYIDHLLSTQPMDEPFFEAAGLPQTFVGNPVLDTDYDGGDGAAFRADHNLNAEAAVIGFFFGSRAGEVERVGPAILKAYQVLQDRLPDMQPVFVVADPIKPLVLPMIKGLPGVIVSQSELVDAMATMNGAVACSGTITTQLAASGVPTVVIYSLSPLTFFVASRIFKPRFISLVNISANRDGTLTKPFMPEFMQDDILTDQPAEALVEIITDPVRAHTTQEALKAETRRMGAGSGSASDRAAEALLALLG